MTENEPDREFVREQYAQYWEMLRLHLNFSWQLPALAVGAVVALLGLGPTSVSQWTKAPLIPATTFLLIGFFFTVIFVHHRRNHMFVRLYENALVRLEERHGVRLEVHHLQIQPKLE